MFFTKEILYIYQKRPSRNSLKNNIKKYYKVFLHFPKFALIKLYKWFFIQNDFRFPTMFTG